MIGIYLITNTITNKVYIGQSNDIMRRWYEHKSRAFDPNNNCYEKPLYRSMRKYGLDAFKLSVLCECSIQELDQQEAKYIEAYNSLVPNGYNILSNSQQAHPERKKYICIKCGKELNWPSDHHLCRECYTLSTRKVERPSAEELKTILTENHGNFTQVAKLFGVTDNSIRKWCKRYNMPYHSADYK